MNQEFHIAETPVNPGEQQTIKLDVARLPSGTRIHLNVFIHRSLNPGPTLLVMGGVHGDEINGVEIIRQAIDQSYFSHLECGNVIAIPLLNIYGFINFSRDVPDGKDVNRSFPGSKTGSLASRVAHTLTQHVLPKVDVGIDFHTGGGSRYNYPQIRISPEDSQANNLAGVFAAPYTLQSRPIAKSFRKEALKQQKPVLVFEGGESKRLDGRSIDSGLAGIKRVMKHLGMITEAPNVTQASLSFEKSTWVRASRSGMFFWSRSSGEQVQKGEVLGVINDPYGRKTIPVKASRTGHIIGHNNAPVVNQGDALFHIGYSR